MQVHAVPDSDKAFDAQGRRLPWAYDVDPSRASASIDGSREPRELVEKGPFGRSQRRSRSGLSRSRSKTAEPRREEDRIRAEQVAAEDAVFGSLRRKAGDERSVLGEVDANAVAAGQQAPQIQGAIGKAGVGDEEATEVLIYGFGGETQWAALDFYERVSGGSILEDYDRQPPGLRYDASRSFGRAASQKSLTKAALRKKNRFAGGLHWIKVTFDSRTAADLATARSPHIVKGHLVYAEMYQGRGPGKDEAIVATQSGAQITDEVLPTTFSTHAEQPIVVEGSPNGSSTTATSATATAHQQQPPSFGQPPTSPTPQTPAVLTTAVSQQASQSQHQLTQRTPHRRRISGATPATVLPASAALMPKQPKQSWTAYLLKGEIIGSTVPQKEDGTFDWERASWYWKIFASVDRWFGTDYLGLKAD